MTADDVRNVENLKKCPIDYERHGPNFRDEFVEKTHELHAKCPIAWSDSYDGHWVASGIDELFAIARRSDAVTSFRDVDGSKNGYKGISIPAYAQSGPYTAPSFLELDPPEQTDFRTILNPYLSPAAVARWVPVIDDLVRACIDDNIESGSIDFVFDLANVVPAVVTMGLLGLPLTDWVIHNEPAHALMYTPPHSPDFGRVRQIFEESKLALMESVKDVRANPRPGLLDALVRSTVAGKPLSDEQIRATAALLVGGGFDTTTALTGQSILWLSQHQAERARLIDEIDTLLDPATEEFLRYVTPAQGDGRTFSQDVEINGVEFKEGERLWLSWAMANRSPDVFPNPDEVDFDRRGNRHTAFGLGIHRCIGSNVARVLFKRMLTAVLERMPDFVVDPEKVVHYESVAMINGLVNLPATFAPGKRIGPGLEETIERVQQIVIEQGLAEPVVSRRGAASVGG
ncbi:MULTISPECIES: cytochrome P450 [Rhodococcus]|uniref:Cytochrome P450 n=1 Tax=Rhodococcus globerulus TaxID=33008 RepID=A0ABU4C1V2_RHOGO|nr:MULTISPECIES: cytochrome P450 [Rhodococcus]MDV6270479.1 cytochrome P450 [Rhodococcus globerulus]MDV8071105.1 cytochrome P450 [Rhodococcus sp. IEGM 1366]